MNVLCLAAQSCLTLCNPMDYSQAPPSMGFSRQEYWRGVPLPSPKDDTIKMNCFSITKGLIQKFSKFEIMQNLKTFSLDISGNWVSHLLQEASTLCLHSCEILSKKDSELFAYIYFLFSNEYHNFSVNLINLFCFLFRDFASKCS